MVNRTTRLFFDYHWLLWRSRIDGWFMLSSRQSSLLCAWISSLRAWSIFDARMWRWELQTLVTHVTCRKRHIISDHVRSCQMGWFFLPLQLHPSPNAQTGPVLSALKLQAWAEPSESNQQIEKKKLKTTYNTEIPVETLRVSNLCDEIHKIIWTTHAYSTVDHAYQHTSIS